MPVPTTGPGPRDPGVLDESARWELLLEAVLTMAAGQSLDGLLTRIVGIAGRMAGARYVALGVVDDGVPRAMRTFVHHGLTDAQVAEIGALPTGHGLLGLTLESPGPLRLADLSEHPASYGFPPYHPPMRSFLGVPIRIRDRVFGSLYLTEKVGGGDFTEQDERIVVGLAAAAGVAVENAQLYEETAQRERWLAATADITARLAGASEGYEALQLVADLALERAGADIAWVVAGPDNDHLSVQVVAGADVDMNALRALPLDRSLTRQVVISGLTEVVDNLASDSRAHLTRTIPGWPDVGPTIVVPLANASGVEGALALGWAPHHADRFRAVDRSLLKSFAEQVALALQVSRGREDQQRLAVLQDRDRIGRDLHDLVIQRLFAIGLGLEGAARQVTDDKVRNRLDTAVDDVDETIKDIRRSIFALGSLESAADVQTEVTRIVERAAGTLKFQPSLRFAGPVRTGVPSAVVPDLLAVLGEALSNAARHADASTVDVLVSIGEDVLLEVVDDGTGFAPGGPESGVRNMRERAQQRGGSCEMVPRDTGGTMLRWRVPIGT